MTARDFTALIHLVGFSTGIVLYGMLAVMSWRAVRGERSEDRAIGSALFVAGLGVLWNAGALVTFGWSDFGFGDPNPWLVAASYAALGFLPAVVVDSATRAPVPHARPTRIAWCAYALSAAAAVLFAIAAAKRAEVFTPSLLVLTVGYGIILLVLAATARRRPGTHRGLAAVALAAFAVSALHLSHHAAASDSWIVALVGHHASLPLVLVILYQDYRFALADLFLKRALSLLALAAVILAAYALLMAPMVGGGGAEGRVGLTGALFAAWALTALAYASLRRAVDRFVDRVILRRTDYRRLRAEIARDLSATESPAAALDLVCHRLGVALCAREASWDEDTRGEGAARRGALVFSAESSGASVAVLTTDAPGYAITVGRLTEGRRLLSDDLALLESVALLVGRHIDELRVTQERFERDLREQEMQRLAAEAELQALRAQLNPHFLFNALTTIGYLIRSSPSVALDTLYQLTSLLRAVLRRTMGEFVSLGEELQIVDAYLAIERARFEERLEIERHVPQELLTLPVPPLVVQPLVENAIKHGIAPSRRGGIVRVTAGVEAAEHEGGRRMLHLIVTDTGVGVSEDRLARGRVEGVGLASVERRLQRYFGSAASMRITSTPGCGTAVELCFPIAGGERPTGASPERAPHAGTSAPVDALAAAD